MTDDERYSLDAYWQRLVSISEMDVSVCSDVQSGRKTYAEMRISIARATSANFATNTTLLGSLCFIGKSPEFMELARKVWALGVNRIRGFHKEADAAFAELIGEE